MAKNDEFSVGGVSYVQTNKVKFEVKLVKENPFVNPPAHPDGYELTENDKYKGETTVTIEQFNGSYSDKAVRFKDYTLKNKTQTQKTLENKVQECGKELSALKRPTQKTLTCPHCGKRTSLNLFWGYRCEHCHSDVTPKTKATKIQKLEEKIATMRKKIDELELKRRTKKFVVKYAVKVEVHC